MLKKKNKIVTVIGLGYVGLPLAVRTAERGYEVFGFDSDEKKVGLIKKGKSPFKEEFIEERKEFLKKLKATTDPKVIKKSDIVIICVPTPVDEKFFPILDPVVSAAETAAKNLKKGALVILESTVNPGVSEEIVAPIFKNHGHKIGRDVFIAHCPERINPGDLVWNVTNLPRVVGSFDRKGLKMAEEYYKEITTGQVQPMKSIREAEAVKIMENSFRDINIAFVNELAKSFDKLGIDIKDVIHGASTKWTFMPHFPSCGVGGHCIPVDPYYLIERAKQSGFDHKFLRVAREINNSMPSYAVELMQDLLNEAGLPMKGTAVGVMGLSYKADVDDLRQSPSIKIIAELKKKGAVIVRYDPYIPKLSDVKNIKAFLKKSQALILVADHKEFLELDPAEFKKNKIVAIVDGKNALNKEKIKKLGIKYHGIGRK